jgi:hypothetical protein
MQKEAPDLLIHWETSDLKGDGRGTRPFLRCQDEILLTMQKASRISNVS